MRASPGVRVARAAFFAALCVALAVAGHGLATGDTPPVGVDCAAVFGVLAPSCVLCGRERSLSGIMTAMLTAQAALHVAFDIACRRPDAMTMPIMALHAVAGSGAPGHSHAAAMAHPAGHPSIAHATLAHLLAALIASWWLRRGEAALWSLLRRSTSLVPGLAAWWGFREAAPRACPTGRPGRRWRLGVERQLLLRHAVSRRGPPGPRAFRAVPV